MHVVCLGLEAVFPRNRHWAQEALSTDKLRDRQTGFKGGHGKADAVKMIMQMDPGASINTPAIVIGGVLTCTTCSRHLLPL